MAKGTTIGFLNFGIDGDNREFLKKIDQIKKKSVSIEQIFKNIKLNTGGKVISPDVQKAQIAADKLSISHNKVVKSAAEMALAETKSANQVLMDTQKLIYEKERLAGLQKRNSLIGVQGQKDLAAAYGLTNKTMFSRKNLLQQLSNAASIYFSIYKAAGFVKELATVSGEFEKQRVSLAAIIGDAEAANRIFNQIKDLAVISPFNFKELTDYAKQLSAFSIPTNEIFDTTKRLADLSAGLGVDMSRIILAYGQVRSAAVLRGQELRQFTEAGIPLVDELAKKFGELEGKVVSAGEVFDKISNRQVPFEMIKEIITDLTSEGGKFYRMQELQSETLAGKISNLRDNYDMMLDSLGKANKGLLHGALDGLVAVMDNWEKYWNILKSIIAAYGTYKAVLITVSTVQRASITLETIGRFVSLTRAITGASAATASLAAANRALGLSSLSNPITAIATSLGVIASAVILFKKEAKSTDEVLADLESTTEKYLKVIDDSQNRLVHLTKTYTELKDNTNRNEQEQRKFEKVIQDIIKIVPNASDEIDKYGKTLSINIEKVRAFNEETREFARQAAGNEIVQAQHKIDELTKRQKFITNILNDDKRAGNIYLPEKERMDLENERFENSLKINELIEKQAKSQSILNGLGKEIDLIAKKYAALAEEIDKTPITNGFNKDQAKADNTVKMLNEMLEVYKRWGQNDLAKDIEKQIETIKKNGEGWRKELQDILGKTITINTESNINDVVDQIKKKYKELADTVKEQADILKNNNFNFDTNSFNFPANNAVTQIAESYKANKSDLDSLGKALQFIGINIASVLGGASGGSGKDEFAEKLKKRIDLLKDVRSEYDKLVKAGKNSDEAATYLMGLDSFKDIDARQYEQDIQKIIDDLRKKGQLSEKQRSLLESLILGKDKDKIAKEAEEITKESKAAFEKIEKELSQYKAQYSLYEYISGKTGDKSQAMKIAFGDIEGQVKSYRDYLVEAIKKTTDPEQKKKLQENLVDLDFTEKSNFAKQMADLLAKYQTTEEKINSITLQGEQQRKKIRETYVDSDYANILIEKSKKSQTEQIDALKTELFQLTPFYRNLFGSLSDYSYRHLNKLAKKAQEVVDTIASARDENGRLKFGRYNSSGKIDGYFQPINGEIVKDENGQIKNTLISIKEYEKILRRIADIRSQMSNQNPLAELMKPLNDYYTISEDGSKEMMDMTDIISKKFEEFGKVVKAISADLTEMFSALGNDDLADTVSLIGDLGSSISDIGSGIVSHNPMTVIHGIIGGITSIANFHDKKLDKAIRKSQLEVQKLQNLYKALEYEIENTYGEDRFKKTGELASNLYTQQIELQKQLNAEQSKKKKDKSAIEDYKKQIADIEHQVSDLFKSIREKILGTSESAASSLASALVNAFKNGESAAKAWGDTVDDIIDNIITNIIATKYILPKVEEAFKKFWNNSTGGTDEDRGQLAKKIAETKTMIDEVNSSPFGRLLRKTMENELGMSLEEYLAKLEAKMDMLNNPNITVPNIESLKDDLLEEIYNDPQFAPLLEYLKGNSKAKDTLSKGIQAVTEDTASILASYMNAMRADLAAQKQFVQQLVSLAQLHTDQFANMYAELIRIQVNTLATANNTAVIANTTTATYNLLRQATISGSGTAINLA